MAESAISAHGVIGDLHTAALVDADGAIDWCCLPRFDSPSVFAALLDREKGGRWQIAPTAPYTSEQRYLPGTNVLVTIFHLHGGGVVELTDFMPVGPARKGFARIYRRVRGVRQEVPVRAWWEPRFDYAQLAPRLVPREHGVLATDRDNDVATVAGPPGTAWHFEAGAAAAEVSLAEGAVAWFVMAFDEDEVERPEAYRGERRLDQTIRWWDAWTARLEYAGPYRQAVERSALALKLCCYEPSGAIVAAPTTSLPESLTGGRTWDYRYAWLRDSAFVLYALDILGYRKETDEFFDFLKRVCRREDNRSLQIMYAVDGARELPEQVLTHLGGYRGAGPVRIGNGAAGQFQLDVYGEVLATAATWARGRRVSEGLWQTLRGLVAWTAEHWREPDNSIWEPRVEPRHHVFSKVMAWTALDRGAALARRLGHDEEATRWQREAAAVHADVLERGWDPARATFVQVYGEPQLDAALLVIPEVRFLPRADPKVRSTLAAIRRELATQCEELIYRYRSPDGLTGDEGAFVICSFWMVQNLAMVGELEEAERLFRNLLRRANSLGLLAEEIDPSTGEQLGNFPLGLSHASLINAAYVIERLRPRSEEQAAAPAATAPPPPPAA